MLCSDLSDQAVTNCREIEAELERMRRRYADTGSIDLVRFHALAQLDVLTVATAAVATQLGDRDTGAIGGNGHAN